jgi:Ser/Thr protein kinase RdoA (MazF antagonist)
MAFDQRKRFRSDKMDEGEIPLAGGIAPQRVVRVGETVRRESGPWTETIFALLAHLAAKGFPAPRPLGLDEAGREILSWVEGACSNHPWPAALLRTEGARQVGVFLRGYHETVADFAPPSPSVWRHGEQPLRAGEIVLHGDFAPHNLLWAGGAPCGLIDFELARPGRPIEDAAFCAISVACLHGDDRTLAIGFAAPPDRRARLAAFAEGWAVGAAELLAAAKPSREADLARMQRLGAAGLEPWANFLRLGLADAARADLAWLEENAGALA